MSAEIRVNSFQKQRIFEYFRRFTDPVTCDSVLSDLIEQQQMRRPACPHCKSTQTIGHGKYRQRQRYKCKDCLKTFNDLTNTPLHRTHHPHKWIKYVECVLEGFSLRRSAIRVGISWVTLFYWRHKIIHILQLLEREYPLLDIPYQNKPRTRIPHYISTSSLLGSTFWTGTYQPGVTPDMLLTSYLHKMATEINTQQKPVTTYLMVRFRTHYPTIPFELRANFVEWIRYFNRIAHKYWKRYVAWFYYTYRNCSRDALYAIRALLIHACSIRLEQTYQSVRILASAS